MVDENSLQVTTVYVIFELLIFIKTKYFLGKLAC